VRLPQRAIILHRINGTNKYRIQSHLADPLVHSGYFCLFCLVPGNICGSLIAIKSYGGELNVQTTYYLLGIMITISGFIGWWNVKRDTRKHRQWMLRTYSFPQPSSSPTLTPTHRSDRHGHLLCSDHHSPSDLVNRKRDHYCTWDLLLCKYRPISAIVSLLHN
jgi:hypothetical protein